jgi:AraC family transcriptional regulator, transcriptional activator of pobA
MMTNNSYTLINPENGNLAFKLFSFNENSSFDHIQRLNYYTLIWIQNGKGKIKVDFSEYDFSEGQLLAFAAYQPFMLFNNSEIKGVVIHFHPDFFCIHKHHQEVACNGVLFNNIYEPPYVNIDEATTSTFDMVLENIKSEMQNPALAQYELLTSYLKIFLITASRLKKEQQPIELSQVEPNSTPFILQNLKNYIELHFKTKHSASEYADLLNISPKALATITKNHFNKTITNLISERIIIEAKRELYLTNKAVKEIAYELGYDDEHYFSRFFKNNADVSPQLYRETVGFARGMN